jgi:hypothetical protein
MADNNWLFGNPRDLIRTPPFMPGRPTYTQPDDDYGTPPPAIAPTAAPALPEAPKKPRKGIWSQIAGEAVGIIAPGLGDRIQYGDYPEQMREYRQNIERRKIQSDLDYKTAQANELRTRANANIGREALFGAQQMKALRRETPSLAPGHSAFDPDTYEIKVTAPPLPTATQPRQQIEADQAKRLGIAADSDGKYYIPTNSMGNYISGVARGQAAPDKTLAGYRQAYLSQGKTEDEADELAAQQFMADRTASRTRTTASATASNARAANAGASGASRQDRNAAAEVKRLADRVQADETTGLIDNAIRNAERFYDDMDPETRQRVVDELKGRKVRQQQSNKKSKTMLNFGGRPKAAATAPSPAAPTAPSPTPAPNKDPLGIR